MRQNLTSTKTYTLGPKDLNLRYVITYHENGGKLAEGVPNPDSYRYTDADFPLPPPTRDDYTFKEWHDNNGSVVTQIDQGSTGDKDFYAEWLSTAKAITAFAIDGQIGDSVINPDAKTVTITLPWGQLTNLAPAITVSEKAAVSPASEELQDFSKGSVDYTVTAEDGSKAPWTVTVVMVQTVTVEPATARVVNGKTQPFGATVTGTEGLDQTVNWTVIGKASEGTTIDTDGNLTVAADETATSLTVRVTSTVDTTQYGEATVTVVTVSKITVSPSTANVAKSGTETFNATVEGTGDPAQTVNWTVIGNNSGETDIGTDGNLTVASDETSTSLTVTATSTVDNTKSGTATVTVITVNKVTVSPATAFVVIGGTKIFTATVTGTGNPAQTVDWTVEGGAMGTTIDLISGVLNVASGETATSLTVTATSKVDGTKYGTATVTIPPSITASYTDMVLATPNDTGSVTITGDSAYYYDSSNDYSKGVFIQGRTVTLSPFSIAKYETTYELWSEVYQWATNNEYTFANAGGKGNTGTGSNQPVTGISWRDAVVWCNAYSEMSGKEPVYYTDNTHNTVLKSSGSADNAKMKTAANGYRLPTEAEWEYAARGGGTPSNTSPFTDKWAGSNTVGDVAWYTSNSFSHTHPVGEKNPNNAWLYDMSGNVYELCWDWYSNSVGGGEVTDPVGPSSGADRMLRGGSWGASTANCAVARRNYYSPPDYKHGTIGFRVAVRP